MTAAEENTRRVTSIEEATRLFYRSFSLTRLGTQFLSIGDSLGRVLATDVAATHDIPALDQSAVDGYAVSARDTFSASPTNPVLLRLKTRSLQVEQPLKSGEAASVCTGSSIPKGSDAVVMVEFTKKIGPDTIEVYRAVAPRENVSWRGEDVRKGEAILREGTRLRPQDLGMLAALGIRTVQVYKRPLVGILPTGSELVPLGSERQRGQVVDVNSIVLSAVVRESGGEPLPLSLVTDDFQKIRSSIKEGLEKSELLLVSGGTSAGLTDLTVKAINSLGPPGVVVHGIAMRPGRPTALASVNGKPIISLSGYPVAAMIGFYVFGRPLLTRMLKTASESEPHIRARVTRRIPSGSGLRSFVRVAVSKSEGGYVADPVRSTGSGVISSMIKANGLVVIPEDVEGVDENEEVDVILFRPISAE